MDTIEIRDPTLVRQLQDLAGRENRSVEAILQALLDHTHAASRHGAQ